MKIFVAITGASLVDLGFELLWQLCDLAGEYEIHACVSTGAVRVMMSENLMCENVKAPNSSEISNLHGEKKSDFVNLDGQEISKFGIREISNLEKRKISISFADEISASNGCEISNFKDKKTEILNQNLEISDEKPQISNDKFQNLIHEISALKSPNSDAINQILSAHFPNVRFYDEHDLSAAPSSGSFGIDATIVAPCSANTLAKVAGGISDTLIARACAVALKERRRLVLGVREMPFSPIMLRQMADLAAFGAIVAPPIYANYARAATIEQANAFIIGKWLDALGVQNQIYRRWR